MSALTGIRVVELADEKVAFAGKLLADMGAEVILVEPQDGTPSRLYPPFIDDKPGIERSLFFHHYNTNKKSIALNLDDESDQQVLRKLITTCDVLLESEPTQRLGNCGLDYPQTNQTNPTLIHCAVTPYGRDNHISDLPVTDLTLMATGGPTWNCGYDDHQQPPVRGWGVQGYQTGCHYAFMSILTALLERFASQRGQFIDVSITAALNVTTEAGSYSWLVAEQTVQRQTGRHAAIQPTGETQMQCADGRYVNTGVPPRFPKEFANLHQWLTKLELTDKFPEAVFLEMGANWEGPFELNKIGSDETITAIFMAGREALKLIASQVSAYEFFTGCQQAGLSVGIIYSPEEAFEDEHFKARGFQVPVAHENLNRTFNYPGAPYRLEKSPWSIHSHAPRLGQHQGEILNAL